MRKFYLFLRTSCVYFLRTVRTKRSRVYVKIFLLSSLLIIRKNFSFLGNFVWLDKEDEMNFFTAFFGGGWWWSTATRCADEVADPSCVHNEPAK